MLAGRDRVCRKDQASSKLFVVCYSYFIHTYIVMERRAIFLLIHCVRWAKIKIWQGTPNLFLTLTYDQSLRWYMWHYNWFPKREINYNIVLLTVRRFQKFGFTLSIYYLFDWISEFKKKNQACSLGFIISNLLKFAQILSYSARVDTKKNLHNDDR